MSLGSRVSSAGRHRTKARWLLIAAFVLSLFAPLIPVFSPVQDARAASMIKFPFESGATWTISQGYHTNPNNGGSHYNCLDYPERSCSQYWTYKYSFDLIRKDGNTSGQPVLSPVNGTIRWIDTAYGGMSINLGNGWAVSYFHTEIAPGLAAGQTVVQGQYMGTVAVPGRGGNGGFPHIHLTLWETTDGGNWSRIARPFSGAQSVDGYDFPALSNSTNNQHRGKDVVSTNQQLGGGGNLPRQVAKTSPAHGASIASSSVTLSWQPATYATSYQVVVDDGAQTSPWLSSTSWTPNSLGAGIHSWKVRARNSVGEGAWSSTWKFTVSTGVSQSELDNGSKIATGTYRVIGTREGLVGGTTSSGHVIVENDHFVSLPSCTPMNCPWPNIVGGETHPTYGYISDCGSNCYVMVTNPNTNICRVEPILDLGPWFLTDNWWETTNRRNINRELARDGKSYAFAQGYTGSDAARDGYDVGWGLSNGIGKSDKGYAVGNRAGIDIADGTWLELGFPWDPGPQSVVVTFLWQTGQSRADAEAKCEPAPGPPPYFTMSKSSGVPGATITVNGKYYGANETVRIYLDSSKTTAIATATTDSTGRFTTTFVVPDTVGGPHRIHAVGRTSKKRVGKDFRILPLASINKSSGSANLTVALTGTNFAAGEVVDVFWDGSTSVSGTGTADSSGKVTITSRAPLLNGAHTAKLTGRSHALSARTTFSVVQRTRVTPTSSESGVTIKAYGTGWEASTTVSFRWNSKTGPILCSATTNSSGYAECTFRAPSNASPGTYKIWGTSGSLASSTSYTIEGVSTSDDPNETATPTPELETETPEGTPEASPTDEAPVESPTPEPTATETEIPPDPTETPAPEPTVAPEPRVVELNAVADTSLSYVEPDLPQSPDEVGVLTAGGEDAEVAFITFEVTGVGAGVVTEAYLVVTGAGDGGGAGGTVGLVPGYWVDEAGLTYRGAPIQDLGAAYALDGSPSYLGPIGGGAVVQVDVSRSIQADGVYSFVLIGEDGQPMTISSREGGAPPRLILVIQD